MNIKDRIENNIILTLVTFSIAVAGTTFSVTKYFYDQELELSLLKKRLDTKLGLIERDIPGKEFFDIRNLISANSETIDEGLTYFPEDKFYSIKSDKDWSYSETTETELLKLISDDELGDGSSAKVHLWKSKENFVLDDQNEKINIFPRITLQRISYDKVIKIIEDRLEQTDDDEELFDLASKAFYQDAAGTFFLFYNFMHYSSSLSSENESFKMKKIQKLGNVLYSQFMNEYSNVKVNGVPGNFFVLHELIIVAAEEHLYLINITLPSTEPNARISTSAKVNNWLTSIKIVMN